MLKDVVPFTERQDKEISRPIRSAVEFMERKLGARFYIDADDAVEPERARVLRIARSLQDAGVINTIRPTLTPCDEPQVRKWYAEFKTRRGDGGGGKAVTDDTAALVRAVAEALERHIWFEEHDYFKGAHTATSEEMRAKNALLPERFAGFSEEQRGRNPKLALRPETPYLWIEGRSLLNEHAVWVPAQAASGYHVGRMGRGGRIEPLLHPSITTGLATGPTRTAAVLSGAFAITWFNRLPVPRIDPSVFEEGTDIHTLLAECARYRLDVSLALLATDAPAYVVCAVVKDVHGGPEVTMGMKAHRFLAEAAKGALLEAVCMRPAIDSRRQRMKKMPEKSRLNHTERTVYWSEGGRAPLLAFLTDNPLVRPDEAWEKDTEAAHLARIAAWCGAKGYGAATVDLGISKKNVTPWSVQMVVIPELQPIHQNERMPAIGGKRLCDVPEALGYAPRPEPYLEEPHPFA
jgi:ribosomal protein S12 methylthiotransferase accessory factor